MADTQNPAAIKESATTDKTSMTTTNVESAGSASKVTKSTKIPLPNLSHTFSRSHDNLASMLRRKAVHNKTRVRERPAAAQPDRPAQTEAKANAISIHKSSSIQNFENGKHSRNFSYRALSVQNICRIPLPIGSKGGKAPLAPKRSSSAQNMINNGQSSRRPTTSTAVSYNAELLSSFEKEKKSLERRISELIQASESRKAEVEKLKYELKKKSQEASDVVQSLHSQNQQLKEQLHEHGITTAHFTDNDKMLLLEQITTELRNSMDFSHDDTLGSYGAASEGAESMNLNRSMMGRSVGNLSSLTPQNASLLSLDFSSLDRQNSMSVDRGLSDIGIAYLRDRIQQMQETHYSTNEELEATLQELADLQDTVNRLTVELENMNDEKSIVLESLCARTEKLENARLQIEHLKALLIQDSDNYDRSENERQLMALLKSAQEEREELMMKQAEFINALNVIENENRELQDIVSALRDRAELEESKSKVFQNDKRTLESHICHMKNEMITNQLDIGKFKALLESERQKVLKAELEGVSDNHGKLEELLLHAGNEKKALEEQLRLANLELAEVQAEIPKLKELNSNLSDSLQMAQSNARMQTKKLESQIEEMEVERMQLHRKVEVLEDELGQSRLRSKQATDESKSQAARLHQVEVELGAARKQADELSDCLQEQKKWFQDEREEWLQLQKDLQVAVVIANDLKMEAEYSLEGVVTENQILKEKVSTLMKDLNGLRLERDILRQKDPLEPSLSRLGLLRQGSNKSPSLTERYVKQIIASSEEQAKGDRPLPSPTLPSNGGDCFSRIRDFKSETSTTEGMPGTASADNCDSGTHHRLTVPEPAFSSSTSISSDTSTPDIEFEAENTGSTGSLGDSSKRPLVGILLNKRQPRNGKFPRYGTVLDSNVGVLPSFVGRSIHAVSGAPLSSGRMNVNGACKFFLILLYITLLLSKYEAFLVCNLRKASVMPSVTLPNRNYILACCMHTPMRTTQICTIAHRQTRADTLMHKRTHTHIETYAERRTYADIRSQV